MNILSLGASVDLGAKGPGDASSSTSQGHAQFELRVGAFTKRELEVVSFEGHEKLSTPYVYDVVFASAVAVEALQVGLFGFPACLSIQSASHEPRVIQGLAVGFEAIGAAESELKTKTRRYMTRIVPRLWLLNHNRKYRVFQDKTAIQIACAVLEEAGITPTIRLQRSEYPPIPFTYQRGETDLEFLHHVLAVAGVFYYFEHASGLLDELMPGGGELGALAGGLGGMAAGEASLSGGFSVGAGGASLGGGLSGGLGGGLAGVAGAVGAVASAVGGATTLVLCDRSRHTHALQDTSLAASAGGAAAAGLGALGGALGGASGSVTAAVGSVVGEVGEGLGDAIPYDGNGQAATASERIFSFRARTEVRPKKVTLRDWSLPESKGVRMVETSAAATLDVSAGTSATLDLAGHGNFSGSVTADLNVDAVPIATKDASVMEYRRDAALLGARDSFAEHALSQLRSDRITAHGASDCRRLAPGYRFRLARHPIAPVNTEYVVTEVRSTGYAPDHLPEERPYLYRSTFDCVPASVDPRPTKPAPRPPLGLEAAVVVGPVYGDVHCDTIGRIQVRFRWAEPSATYAPDADGTCWVHWLERWAGNGFGTMTFPRVGTEVLVDFLQGEGGRPIAVGQFYSGQNSPPFALPAGATRIGIRSQAIPPASGYSEFAIEDTAGQQRVHLRAEGPFDVVATDHHTCRVVGDSTVTIGGSLREVITGERVEMVSGNAVTDVAKDSVARVAGARRVEVRGPLAVATSGDETRTTGGTLQSRVGKKATHTYAADTEIVVGHPDREGTLSTFVYGTSTIHASKAITLESDTSIVLKCGDTTLAISSQGVTLDGQTLALSGKATVNIQSPNAQLMLDDNVGLNGKAVSVTSTGAALALDSAAKLSGSKVSLGNGSGKGGSASRSPSNPNDSPKPVYIRTRLLRSGSPVANVGYTLTLDTGLVLSGTTDGDGKIEQKVPATATTVTLRFCDTGEIRNLIIGAPESVDTVLGAQMRLKRLGFYHAGIDGRNSAITLHALNAFQKSQGIDVTGKLDAATQAALTKAYGS